MYLAHDEPASMIIIIGTITMNVTTMIVIMHVQYGQQGGHVVPRRLQIAAMMHKAATKSAHIGFRDMIAALPVV